MVDDASALPSGHGSAEPSRSGGGAGLFAPSDLVFSPVSPALAKVRIIGNLIWLVPVALGFAAGAILADLPLLWIGTAVAAAQAAWLCWLIPRQVRAMGFAEGDDEFVIRRGVMFRSMTLIPYGRIQYVDVAEGPIARMFGIAQIKLNTASAQTDATLDGVPVAEASRLRDLLAERGSAELAGL
ncbi:PH domain-containing protein [Actinomyces sp. B33]|uniref:PH domain-containing protein n=1 Tax=Actinomyces sp. B33 TaxID=2942131 RepID=UPI0023422D9F|nr:PH domain-containing protein [Actinomyces sp. B33]MDC4232219.1 PH domain-containing protein [Actinomyces sp. B33]